MTTKPVCGWSSDGKHHASCHGAIGELLCEPPSDAQLKAYTDGTASFKDVGMPAPEPYMPPADDVLPVLFTKRLNNMGVKLRDLEAEIGALRKRKARKPIEWTFLFATAMWIAGIITVVWLVTK